ncbi:MAG: hypothetical protein PVJ02_06210 [Gemmatimonadota bacterium]|jgi:hypothetical protein
MNASAATVPPTPAAPYLSAEELEMRYAVYRRRQASRLVQMLPRDAIRPLYRTARRAAGAPESLGDPLALLVAFCEELLPLPSFDVWCDDLRAHPDAHLADLDDSVDGPTADAPSTLAVQEVEVGGRRWRAHLRAYRDAGLWRGFIAFEDRDAGSVHRTAVVFCEGRPGDLRERFLSFGPAALRAFLRSALP